MASSSTSTPRPTSCTATIGSTASWPPSASASRASPPADPKHTRPPIDDLTRRRLAANRALWAHLGELIEAHPDQRFGQILRNFGFVHETTAGDRLYWSDEFNQEPMKLLARVEAAVARTDGT